MAELHQPYLICHLWCWLAPLSTTYPYPYADVAPAGRTIILITYSGETPREVQGEYHTLFITFTARSRLLAFSIGPSPLTLRRPYP